MADYCALMLLCFACGLLSAEAGPVAKEHSCPNGWFRFGSRCFMFFHNQKPWIEAEKSCLAVGGNLASVKSKEENAFIVEQIHQVTGAHPRTWIGGHDSVKENVWLWSDGSNFDDFKFWAGSEPNNAGKGEDCLMINFHGDRWFDAPCGWAQSYLCSRED